jgi:hypothetical protein
MAARNFQLFGSIFAKHVACGPLTFAKLPASPETGEIAYITDAGQNTVGSAVTSGGSTNKVLAWYNGTQWTCFGK